MEENTRKRILKALETDYGNAVDNVARARIVRAQRSYSSAEAALFREYEKDEEAALKALKDFDPNWKPKGAFR